MSTRLLDDIDDFPTIPEVATRVMSMLDDPDCDLEQCAEQLCRDAILSARLVGFARSPLFGARAGHEELSVRDAIMRLGMRETRAVVVSVAVMSSLPCLPQPLELRNFWTLGLGSALAAQHLAEELEHGRPEEAYLAGLVHAVGDAYLAINHPQRFTLAVEKARHGSLPLERALHEEFGVSPSKVTAAVLRHWGMPDPVVSAAEYQFDPEKAPDDPLLAGIVFAADRICRDLRLAPDDRSYVDRRWIDDIPRRLVDRIEALGYPDIRYYVTEHKGFLEGVRNTVQSTFA